MPTRINYITGRTSEFDEFRKGLPVHLVAGGFLICTSGSSEVVLDSKQYRVKAWDLMVAFPHSYAHAIHTSDDFDGVIFGVDMGTLISTDLKDKSFYITSIANSPCISLKEEEAQKILRLREEFLLGGVEKDHPLRREIDEARLKIIIYEIAALFRSSQPNAEHERSRDDIIFNDFILDLYSTTTPHRTLEYYAQRASITTSHLSKVIKRVSKRTASEWISGYTILCIRRLLQDREISIATIAERLNFPNASFLSQYFKKYTSQSPKQYRGEFFE